MGSVYWDVAGGVLRTRYLLARSPFFHRREIRFLQEFLRSLPPLRRLASQLFHFSCSHRASLCFLSCAGIQQTYASPPAALVACSNFSFLTSFCYFAPL